MRYVYLFLSVWVTINVFAIAPEQDSLKEWTPESMVKLPLVTATATSSNGDYVAYTVRETKMDGEDSKYLTQLWVASSDGAFNRQFTQGDESISNPEFTPDGKFISFLTKRNEHQQVYQIPIDGGEAYAITNAPGSINSYKWAPDGKSIAYIMTDPETDEDKKRKKEKTDVILVDKQYKLQRLYNHNISADTARLLFEDDVHVTSFDWSPDGSQIVFAHQPTPRINDRYKMDIALVSSDSGAIQTLVAREGNDSSPIFSRDGQRVFFTSSGGQKEAIGLQDIYSIELSDLGIKRLALTHDRSANLIGLDDQGRVLYNEFRGTNLHLFRMAKDGKTYEALTTKDGIHGRASLSENGRYLSYTYENMSDPREVFAGSIADLEMKKVSKVFDHMIWPEMGKTELISWSSPDGTKIEGLLTYPVGYQSGEKVPMILMVHGGPAGVYNQSWTGSGSIYAIQYFAANGYALLRPNPRGSTGYGKDFRYANFQDWGYGDYEDLMSGVDKVLDMGVADPNNLFEMGWSYGGYMTSWIVTQTDRFNAVSMGAGLSNLVSMTGTTDIADYLTGHLGGPYWSGNMKTYEKHSAIYFMDNVTTPTQIIHGKEDLRVPISQSQEFYWALNERNVPTEMIVYPRTPHGPREPKFLADVSERIYKWFESYKK